MRSTEKAVPPVHGGLMTIRHPTSSKMPFHRVLLIAKTYVLSMIIGDPLTWYNCHAEE